MYKNLLAKMSRAGITSTEMSNILGITLQAFIYKKQGKSEWKLKQMVVIQEQINQKLNTNYTLDYLFKKD